MECFTYIIPSLLFPSHLQSPHHHPFPWHIPLWSCFETYTTVPFRFFNLALNFLKSGTLFLKKRYSQLESHSKLSKNTILKSHEVQRSWSHILRKRRNLNNATNLSRIVLKRNVFISLINEQALCLPSVTEFVHTSHRHTCMHCLSVPWVCLSLSVHVVYLKLVNVYSRICVFIWNLPTSQPTSQQASQPVS